MNGYQIAIIVILGLNVLSNLLQHGEPRKGNYDVYSMLVSVGIWVFILTKGGFFE